MSEQPVCRRTITVSSDNGLHIGPCSHVARLAQTFRCAVQIRKGEQQLVDAKSVLDLLTLGAEQGTDLVLEACGEDAEEAIEKLAVLFASNFELGDFSAA
jgi:phosphocarrier protein HPr